MKVGALLYPDSSSIQLIWLFDSKLEVTKHYCKAGRRWDAAHFQ